MANRLSQKTRHIAGAQLFLMAAQDLRIGGRSANATYRYSLQADDLDLLRRWTPKVRRRWRDRNSTAWIPMRKPADRRW